MDVVDYLIVGAGTAGCVLAAGLSADPGRHVLVVEAGPDFPTEESLPEVLRTGSGEGFDWGLTTTVQSRATPLARGRVVGGSSQVNAAGMLRAPAADFDAWAGLGLPAWSWERVLPAYRRLETDQQYGDRPYHGAAGPVPITRPSRDELSPAMAGFLQAVIDCGHELRDDMNAPDAAGIGLYPQNRRGATRMSTNLTHLAPARGRANLRVRADLTVDRIVVRGGRAVGVAAGAEEIAAGEVILCAGSPLTPALLLRSGIGPAGDLRAVGVPVVVDLPGVGRGVYDQPGAVLPAVPAPGSVPADDVMRTQLIGRLAAIPGHPVDNAFYANLFTGPPPGGGPVLAAIMVGDLYPRSRGTVTLDADLRPRIDSGFYDVDDDLARMRAAYRHAWEIAQQPPFARMITGFAMIDETALDDDGRLDAMLRAMTFSRLAVAGGAAMGPAGDPDAVVDERCRVRGVEGLRVVDLSVVPVPLRATTAFEAMMIGEHASRLIADSQ
jgi:choline dehydrogenase